MNTQASTFSQEITLRFRPDLSVVDQWFGGRRFWLVKDPVSLRYFKFREEEYAIIQLLNGQRNLRDIKARFDQRFAPRRLTPPRLQTFLASLYRNGLLISDGSGQADRLLSRRQLERRSHVAGTLTNILAIRLPGIDPRPVLDWLYPRLRWCLSPAWLTVCGIFSISALLLIVAHATELRARLPDFQSFVSAQNMIWLAIVMASTKLLHELGHALTCRHFGGDCHEMGVMLLVFTPCLYCNVTDSWMLRNRWQRITISGAGMFVEVMLASVAAFFWWYSQPGLFNAICLNVMAVCAVGTLLLNGNPLLRYDGYFILSDLLEAPNLWNESRALIRHTVARFTLGLNGPDGISDPRRKMLAVYGMASMVYRVFVTFAIFLFLVKALAPMGLQSVAYLIALPVTTGLVWSLFTRARMLVSDPLVRRRINGRRLLVTVCLTAAGGWFLFFVPIPRRIAAPLVLEPQDSQPIYVSTSGMLVDAVKLGAKVTQGQVLARLQNPDLQREVAKLAGERTKLEQRIRNLEVRAADDAAAAANLVATHRMVADVQQRLAQRQREFDSLTITAPASGTVLSPPPRHIPARPNQLQSWSGTPLDPSNVGCTLERGSPLCLIGDPSRFKAILFVDEAVIELVRETQPVRMAISIAPGSIASGIVSGIADQEIQVIPPELAVKNEIPHQADSDNTLRPVKAFYHVSVTIGDKDPRMLNRARGRARIQVDPQPLGKQLVRQLRRTFTAAGKERGGR